MPPYKCLNKDCKMYKKVDKRSSKGFIDKQTGNYVDTAEPCPLCGKPCELQLPEHFSTNLKNFS